ncbi:MAG: PKD domain-containing protein [Bacteroidota bacterium]
MRLFNTTGSANEKKPGTKISGLLLSIKTTAFAAFFVLAIASGNSAIAQSPISDDVDYTKSKIIKSAHKDQRHGHFTEARDKLFKLYDADTNSAQLCYELAMNYYKSPGEKSPGIAFFRRTAAKTYNPDTLRKSYFYMAELMQQLGNYKQSLAMLEKVDYFKDAGNEITADKIEKLRKVVENANHLTVLSTRQVRVSNLGPIINTSHSEYAPIFNDQETALIFTGRKMYAKGNTSTTLAQEYFEDNYATHKERGAYVPPVKFRFAEPAPGSPKAHNSAISYGTDQKTLYTYRDRRLWMSTLKDNLWMAPELLNNNINFGTIQTHASITTDGKMLYFTSDGPGGYGGYDIWRSRKGSDGNWGPAENLGPTINTPLNEESPTFSADGKILYFSSKGHNSIGGYDIFMSSLFGNQWSEPVNMGSPINSTEDDVHFVINKKGTMGYFSSRRAGGFGESDIYKVLIFERPEFLECRTVSNTELRVDFNAKDSEDKLGMKQYYIWDFADGTRGNGLTPSHVFKHPGKYKVTLNVMDSASQYIQYNEKTIDLDIKGVDHLDVILKDTINAGETVLLDASFSTFKKGKIRHWGWSMGDTSIYGDTSRIYHTWDVPGEYTFRLDVLVQTDTSSKVVKFCVMKTVNVLPEGGAYGDAVRAATNSRVVRPRLTDANGRPVNDPKNPDWFKNALDRELGGNGGTDPNSNGNGGSNGGGNGTYPGGRNYGVSVNDIMNGTNVALLPIFYDFDDTRIRNDAAKNMTYNMKVLDQYKGMTIKVVAHADSRGKNNYNIGLSRKRARQAIIWMRDHGFDTNRIISVVAGGEEIPVNKCFDNVECSPEDHQSNRLVEFIVAGNTTVE